MTGDDDVLLELWYGQLTLWAVQDDLSFNFEGCEHG
jgi:hypothetical protein